MPALIRPFGFDIVPVKPLPAPTGKLYYMDFIYESISEKRRKKIG
jgi:hypothetical protein